jgi:hypothetical protein
MDPVAVAGDIGWAVIERCSGGEFGAYLVERGTERAVLKLHQPELDGDAIAGSVALAARVRERGQLVPRYLDVGQRLDCTYTVQEFVPGVIPEPLTQPLAAQMLELLECHAGAAVGFTQPAGFTPWWDASAVVRTAGGAVAALGDENNAVPPVAVSDDDVRHDDYHLRNLLVLGGRITAIFDWEGARRGDRRFDAFLLAWTAHAAPELATRDAAAWLRHRVEAMLNDQELAFYAAAVARRFLDFNWRTYPDRIQYWVDAVEAHLAPYWRG